jgi:hypothetical protein
MAINAVSGEEVQLTVEDKTAIAQGGWATVYRAKLAPSGAAIAIKEVKETSQYKVGVLRLSAEP